MLNEPAKTLVTNNTYKFVPVCWFKVITSLTATWLFVTVNVAAVVEPAAENKVIAPVELLSVTPVVLDVI